MEKLQLEEAVETKRFAIISLLRLDGPRTTAQFYNVISVLVTFAIRAIK